MTEVKLLNYLKIINRI